MRKIPVTVVTGLLGAGKTSLIRHLLRAPGGRRIALLVDALADIDCELLAGGSSCGEDAGALRVALTQLIDRPDHPDHIILEASGLAPPRVALSALRAPEVAARVTVDGVVAVVDAAALDSAAMPPAPADPLALVFAEQLAMSDLVLLNKIDAVADAALARIEAALAAQLRPGVRLLRAAHGAVAPRQVLGLAAAAGSAAPPAHSVSEGSPETGAFERFVVLRGPIDDPVGFARTLADVIARHRILRLKGVLDVADFDRRQLVQTVGPRIERHFDRRWNVGEERVTRVIVIGPRGVDRAAVAAALAE